MKEHSSRKVNVLGTDVSVMRAEKAVNLTMDYMRRKGLEVVFFHSAESSLYCQNQPGAAEIIGNCQLVLPGDSHVEMAVRHQRNDSEDRKGIGEFADEYLKRLFAKLNRESREIYAVMEKQEHLDSLKEYIGTSYPDIFQNGIVFDTESGEDPGKIVNEINANIPDIVFLCLPVEQQIMFIRDYAAMMNTRLCICIESVQPLIRKETENAPPLIQALHLDDLWFRLKRESIIRKTVVGSIFKQKVLEDAGGEVSPEAPGRSTAADESAVSGSISADADDGMVSGSISADVDEETVSGRISADADDGMVSGGVSADADTENNQEK